MKEDTFLGEGNFLTLHPGDESAPIPYCVETGCEVAVDYDMSTLKFHRIQIKDGAVELTRKRRQRTIYRVRNKKPRRLDFMLNHPFLDGWELLQKDPNNPENEFEQPVDITDRTYQFRFPVEAKVEKKVFNVRESTNDVVSNDIDEDVDREMLESWNEEAYIDQETFRAMTDVLDMKSEIWKIVKEIFDKEGEIRELNTTETRLRANIKALQGHESNCKKYVKQLGATEDRINSIQGIVKRMRLRKSELSLEKEQKIDIIEFSRELSPGDEKIEETA